MSFNKVKLQPAIPPAEWFDLDRNEKMRQHVIVRFEKPIYWEVEKEDGSIEFETTWEKSQIAFPDTGDVNETITRFTAAYSECRIIEIEHQVVTE